MPATPYATLFDIILRLAHEILVTRQGTATGGSATTLEDTAFHFQPDQFKDGTLFILHDGAMRKIIEHTTEKFTISPAYTAPANGDAYVVAAGDIPLDVMIAGVNASIRNMILPGEDVTQVTVASQEEYTLPANVSHLFRVEIATSKTSPYGYAPDFHWDEIDGKLRWPAAFAPGSDDMKMRLTFRKPHTEIVLETAVISNDVDLDYLHWSAVQYCAKHGLRMVGSDTKHDWPAKIQEAEVRLQRGASRQIKLHRDPRHADY